MQHFFVSPDAFQDDRAVLGPETSRQLHAVLRVTPGIEITLLDNAGNAYLATIETCTARETSCRIVRSWRPDTEPQTQIVLFQAVPKNQRLDMVLQKGTEVGVSVFVPLLCEHSVVRAEASASKLERWRRIVQEAAEQCGRARIPEIRPPAVLREALSENPHGASVLMACLAPEAKPFSAAVLSPVVHVFVGPEGGFTRQELEMAIEQGAQLVSLGKRILRSETAGIVASALALYQRGELG